MREAVVNAVLHRDYDDPGNLQVRIFDDRQEVWSPGLLVGGKDIDSLEQDARSIPRNRNLVRLAKFLGPVEAWGTGFQRMAESCLSIGLPHPSWRHTNGAFVTTFRKRITSEGVSAAEDTGSTALLALVRATPGLRSPQLAARLDVPLKTAERRLATLRRRGDMEFHGSPKTGGYRTTKREAP